MDVLLAAAAVVVAAEQVAQMLAVLAGQKVMCC